MAHLDARLWSVLGNSQRLDGLAMFRSAPRAVWKRWAEPDEDNRIPLATRALLVREASGRNVLLEAGIGAFMDPVGAERYGVVEDGHVLLENLSALGLAPDDIDIVVLSHLHFDHAGGLLAPFAEDRAPTLVFGRASYVVSEGAWSRARHPHPRDRASFITDLPDLLEATDRVEVVDATTSRLLGPGYTFHFSQGHTPGLMLTEIDLADGPVVFVGDLIPGRAWVHLPITMGYDRFPELLVDEKADLLEDLYERNGRLFFTHDPEVAMSSIGRSSRPRYHAGETWAVLDGTS